MRPSRADESGSHPRAQAGLIEQHLALRMFSPKQVTSDPHKMALRDFVDGGFTLVGLLDAYLNA